MSKLGLKIVLPSAVDDASGLKKLEHYTGIEFTRGASDGGGVNGYHKLIGDETLIKEQRFLNMMKVCAVKDAKITHTLNQTNWNKYDTGEDSVLDGTDGADIMACFPNGIYAILGGTDETYERFIISDSAFSYDGDYAMYIPPIALPTDHATVWNGVARMIRNNSVAGSTAAGSGTNFSTTDYGTTDGGGYPRTLISRKESETCARAKNEDAGNGPYLPYYNLCLELYQALLFIEFRTKNLNGVLGHAISSNVIPTAATWGTVSGWRATSDNGSTYIYGGFGTNVYVSGTAINMGNVINRNYSLLKIFESQLAVSGGDTLEKVKNADGEYVQNVDDGVMTGIWTKRFSFTLDNVSSTQAGEQATWSVDVILRQPIVRGAIVRYGNIQDWVSGYETIKTVDEDGAITNTLYRCDDYTKLSYTTNETIPDSELFDFETNYTKIGSFPEIKSGINFWAKDIWTDNGISTAIGENLGGNMGTFENSYVILTAGAVSGKKRRHNVRFGGKADSSTDALRYADFSPTPFSYATASSGFAFCVLLDEAE
jgi:hypothetical protein